LDAEHAPSACDLLEPSLGSARQIKHCLTD